MCQLSDINLDTRSDKKQRLCIGNNTDTRVERGSLGHLLRFRVQSDKWNLNILTSIDFRQKFQPPDFLPASVTFMTLEAQ